MKIVAISNPHFTGVTVATKAVCHEYVPAPHLTDAGQVMELARAIMLANPDVLVIGGWSKGYVELLQHIETKRNFPVVSVYHSSLFHGAAFADEIFWGQMERAYNSGLTDVMGYVQPQTAEYYQWIKRIPAVWVPHTFPPQPQVSPSKVFRIGVFGGTANILKNCYGALLVAKDFAHKEGGCEVIAPATYDQPREFFLNTLRSCSMLIHLSHLECYSNTIQEAWASGIPVIMSLASNALTTENRLLTPDESTALSVNNLYSGTDAMELYRKMLSVQSTWRPQSDEIYSTYANLYARTRAYLDALFTQVCKDYRAGRMRSEFSFPEPKDFWEIKEI